MPNNIQQNFIPLSAELIKGIYNPRRAQSHKGSFGHALIVAGSAGKMGAAVIATRACLRAGAGLTSVLIPANERLILQTSAPEAMCLEKEQQNDLEKYNALGVGPGMGMTGEEEDLLRKILSLPTANIVIDADAITILSKNRQLVTAVNEKMILTPHIKEFDRLFGNFQNDDERVQFAQHFCQNKGCIIILKSWQTHIISPHSVFVNQHAGNPGLAKGGSGDALTGTLTAMLAQHYSPENASLLGVYLHASAADLAVEKQSEEALLASDVIEHLGDAFRQLQTTGW